MFLLEKWRKRRTASAVWHEWGLQIAEETEETQGEEEEENDYRLLLQMNLFLVWEEE